MSEAINKSDLVKGNPFEEIAKDIDQAVDSLNKFDKAAKDIATTLKNDLNSAQKTTLQGIDKINQAEKQSEKALKEKLNNEKLLIQVETQKEKLKQAEIRTTTQLRREEERLNKITVKQAKAVKDEANAYKKLSDATRKQKNDAKNLAAQMLKLESAGRRNTKEYRDLASQYRRLSKEALRGDKALKKIDSRLGDNFRSVGNYQKGLRKLSSTLGSLGVAFGAGALIRGAGGAIIEFEQSVADLQAITGAAGEDLQFFKDQAIELGKTTKGGASAVVEAYKLIGSAKPELLENAQALDQVAQSAITLSKASGLELPDAATRLTDAMNQFGASASEADKFINVLAASSKAGAAEIPDVTDAMLKFGAVAKVSNVSVEESAGLIETLAENGLKGAEAGTGLRNIMLKLSAPDALPKEAAESLKRLGISFEDLKDPSKTFAERLEIMKPLLSDSAALQKVFGKENAVAALNVIQNTDRIKELTAAVTDSNVASEQADTRSKTLGEAFENIGRAWDSFILSLVNGEDSTKGLRDFLDWVANNIPTIISYFVKLVKVIGTYKAVLFALKLKDKIQDFIKFGKAVKGSGEAADGAKKGIKGFGQALKGIGLTVAITLLIEFATAFYDVASGAAEARMQVALFNQATARGSEKANALLEKNTMLLEDNIRAIRRQAAEKGLSQKEEDALILKETQRAKKRVENALSQTRKVREARRTERQEAEETLKTMQAEQQSLGEFFTGSQLTAINNQKILVANLKAQEREFTTAINIFRKGYTDIDNTVSDMVTASIKATDTQKETVKGLAKEQKAVKELTDGWKEYLDWRKQVRTLEDERRQAAENVPDFGGFEDVDVTGEDITFTTFEDIFNSFNNLQVGLTEIATEQIDKRIELMRKEEEAAKGQQTYLENLAAQGNITAQQSIAEQIEIQREAQREQARLEKQKQTIQLISQGLTTFNTELESGKKPGEALASTILSTSTLVSFLKNIQFFAKGTDNAPGGMAVVDEEGAELITDAKGKVKQLGTDGGSRFTHLNKGDKVYTAKQTSEILQASSLNENATQMNKVKDVAGNSYDIMILNKSLQEIKSAVNGTPSNNMDWQGLKRVFPEFARTMNKGGDVHTERFKVKRS